MNPKVINKNMHNIKFDQKLSFNPKVMFDHHIKDGSFTTYFKCYSKNPFNHLILTELFKCIRNNDYINSKYNRSSPKICQISAVYIEDGNRIITPILPKFLFLHKFDNIIPYLTNNLETFARAMFYREFGFYGDPFSTDRGLPWNVNGISYFEVRFWKFNNSIEVIRDMHFIAHFVKGNREHEEFIDKYNKLVLSSKKQEVNIHETNTNSITLHNERLYEYK